MFQNYFSSYTGQAFPAGVLVNLDHPANGGGDLGSLLLDTAPASSVFSNACKNHGLASLPGFCDAELQTGYSFVDFQHMLVVASHDAATGNEVLTITFDTFARLVGLPVTQLPRYPGSVTGWQDAEFAPSTAFVVGLPPGRLTQPAVARYADGVQDLAAGAG